MQSLAPVEIIAILILIAVPFILLTSIVVILINRNRATSKKCTYCAEVIKKEAIVCRYCGRDVVPATESK